MPELIQANVANHLLSTISPESFARLQPHLEPVDLTPGTILVEADHPTPVAWFVEAGLVSALASTTDGQRIEIGHIGFEGLIGSHVVHLDDRTPHRFVVHMPGHAYRISMPLLSDIAQEDRPMLAILLRYAQAYEIQIAHTALANGRYTVRERLARWLLMCHDRIDGDTLPLTHDFLSDMLGVRRSTVTNEIHALEGEGIIKATRASMAIRDRAQLEGVAGGCYGVPEREYDRLVGRPSQA